LSVVALSVAAFESYAVITNVEIVPPLTGPVLAIIIIISAFGCNNIARIAGKASSVDNKP